uniref:Meg domain-containing protein n=1 Tax=Zea mays TaxID=4577 RepID=A0A804Q6B8_MAIZE
MEYRKRVDALVFFSLLLLGYFAAHAHGKAKEGIMQGNGARCVVGFPPCKDNKCYCCIGGRTHARYSTMAECRHACF